MISQVDWKKNNDEHLAATIRWVRLRLEQLAQPANEGSEPGKQKKCHWFKRSKKNIKPKDKNKVDDHAVEQARQKILELEDKESPPALNWLAKHLGLSKFDQNILALCTAMELDTQVSELCAQAQNNLNKPYPTFALAFKLFENPDWSSLSPEAPLRYWRLLEINQPVAQPLTGAALAVDERIVNYLKGLNYLDDRLTPLLEPIQLDSMHEQTANEALPPPSQQQSINSIIEYLKHSNGRERTPVIELLGHDSASKRLLAQRVASILELNLYGIDLKTIPGQAGDVETFSRLWQRECLLMPLALYIT